MVRAWAKHQFNQAVPHSVQVPEFLHCSKLDPEPNRPVLQVQMQKPDYKGHLDRDSLAIPKAWEMQKEFCFPIPSPSMV